MHIFYTFCKWSSKACARSGGINHSRKRNYYVFWVCVCSLIHPWCTGYAFYYIVVFSMSGCFIYIPTLYLTNGTISGKPNWKKNVGSDLFTTFVWNIFHSKKKWARYDQILHWYLYIVTTVFVMFLMKLEISGQIFEKYSNIIFHENPSSGRWVVPCGR